ncbi:oxysterol-binding protein-related protein 1D [Tanacetum coccineum]
MGYLGKKYTAFGFFWASLYFGRAIWADDLSADILNGLKWAQSCISSGQDGRFRLPPTDSRLRPNQRHLENGEYELANAEKLRLEQLQRQARKLQERGWRPKWFQKDEDGCFHYMGGYWETRDKKDWNGIPDIFGQSVELPPSVEEA